MPASAGDLRRGRIVHGLFPFATQFPVELADASAYRSVERFAAAHTGVPARLIVEVRLRPVLILRDGSRDALGDVVCLRINTVKPALKRSRQTWQRIESNEHPAFFHLPAGRYGLPHESVIAISSIGTVNKNALLGPPVGGLTQRELQSLNERLARGLQLDLAPLISARARELLARAGIRAQPDVEPGDG